MTNLLEEMVKSIQRIAPDERFFSIPLQMELSVKRNEFKNMLTYSNSGSQRHPKMEFAVIATEPFLRLASALKERIERMDSMYLISEADAELDQFFADNVLKNKSLSESQSLTIRRDNPISSVLLASEDVEWKKMSEKLERCLTILEAALQKKSILKSSEKKGNIALYRRDTHDFEVFLSKNAKVIQKCYDTQKYIIAIISEHRWGGQDLIMTTGSISLLEGKKKRGIIRYFMCLRLFKIIMVR